MERDALRPVDAARIFARLVADDGDALDAFGRHLLRDLRNGELALMRLTAGHGDRVVVEDLVGDVDARRDRRADRHRTGMIIGAVAEILEHMVALGERRLADPVRALAAHMGVAERVAVHPLRHEMAADAGIGAHAFRHHGRGIVRAAGAEIGRARRHFLQFGQRMLRLFQPRDLRRRWRRRCGAPAARSPMVIATSFGSSAPLTGNSQLPRSSFLPMQTGWLAVP